MKKSIKKLVLAAASMAFAAVLTAALPAKVQAAYTDDNGHTYEWIKGEDGKMYWYEDGVKQGTEGRGKEIYDPESDAWYWLDAEFGGAMAVSKDTYQESKAGKYAASVVLDEHGNFDYEQSTGKWVRYDSEGHMIKGWCTGSGEKAQPVVDYVSAAVAGDDIYYFDETYGTMAKGYATIERVEFYFNMETGVLERVVGPAEEFGWAVWDGGEFWYENFERQGVSVDPSYRGKEIYDPDSNAWYWLDNDNRGGKAVSKDVYQESEAGDWGTVDNGDGIRIGKWVRYDSSGHMIKGWDTNENGDYYFDETYGTMARGTVEIDGKEYTFDSQTGICTTSRLADDEFDILKMSSGTVIEGDITLTGTGTGYHAKFVVGNATSAVSFGIQYDTASREDVVRGKQGLLVENIASNNPGGQNYFWPEKIVVEAGQPAHLMLYVGTDGKCSVYYNYKKIAEFENAGLADTSSLYARVEACARLEGDTVDAVFTNLKVQYPAYKYTSSQVGTPQQLTTANSCKTIYVDCDAFKRIRIYGTVTGIGGQDWDSAYDSVSGYAMLFF